MFLHFYGFFRSFPGLVPLASVLVTLILGFVGAPFILWTLALAALLIGFAAPKAVLIAFAVLAILFNLRPLRAFLVSAFLMEGIKKILPKISDTERVALEAGVVWIEKDLFSGKPDFKKILAEPYPELSPEEKAFLEGPVNRLCELCDDWKIWQTRELPPAAWEILKKEKFFGMIIPKEYGGLGFSALAHSAVIQTLSSRSLPLAVTAMVPNSLGPAELLIHYGTEEQKKYLLPRLARGEELPCFALTEPGAGSDAASIVSSAVLFKGEAGKLYLRLNWDKRWITLAAISTLLGLAFRLYDPDNLLGKGSDLGITCALIPSNTKGVVLGRRHDPLGVPFYNCPTQGQEVIVSVDCIVGGIASAGKGWMMLMECLAAGRGISLPAQSCGGAKLAARVASNHASIRKQFGMPIGSFEGVEEALARLGAFAYLLEASRRFVCGALNQGIKPPVITAIAKYHSTELARKCFSEGMDIMGGSGISTGRRNLLAHSYIAAPIGITVEGANIMTRTLIIFGQGLLRAHPYVLKEVDSAEKGDLRGFDRAFWGHVGHVVRNTFRAVLLSLSRGHLAFSPVRGPVAKYYRKLSWASARFALMSDIAMGALGGRLKFREKISGRFADVLSWMFLCTATLRRFEAEGRRKEDLPLVHYALQYGLRQIQLAFEGIFKNIAIPGFSWFFAGILGACSRINPLSPDVSDSLSHQVAALLQKEGEGRDRLCEGIYYPTREGEALRRMETAFKVIKAAEETERKLRLAVHSKRLPKLKGSKLLEEALRQGLLSEAEVANLQKADELREEVIAVDSFTQEEYLSRSGGF
ncbi:MAG: acyl-CoA dehydrogenase [Deltaproteobacteria bacterium]|nr:acyl-CoA dehydrogenase [Deltaproteobacteria bacterium]